MKKLIITLSIVAALCLNANAQYFSNSQTTDGFFSSATPSGNYRDGSANDGFPGLPGMGIYGDQGAPLGSGLLLLAGMGAVYAMRRRSKN